VVARTSKQIFLFAIALLSLFIIHLFLSINIHFNKIAIEHLNSYLEESREEVQSPSRGNPALSLVLSDRLHHFILYCLEFFFD